MPPKTAAEWNARYEESTTPWDSGLVSRELVAALDAWGLAEGRALELGCGTGTNCVHLAERGFDVTGIDMAPLALERARDRAVEKGVDVSFEQADVLHWPGTGEPYDVVFDRGCFHCVRGEGLYGYLSTLRAVTRPGTRTLLLTGNADRPEQGGPPTLNVEQIGRELEPMFQIDEIRRFHFEDPGGVEGPLGWALRLQRR